eukprot:8223485-Pyramimonas_sp.AAC.1
MVADWSVDHAEVASLDLSALRAAERIVSAIVLSAEGMTKPVITQCQRRPVKRNANPERAPYAGRRRRDVAL